MWKNGIVWFKEFFDGGPNTPSTTRALAWIWTITLCAGILFCVVFNAIKNEEVKMPTLDSSYIAITGVYIAAKVGQKIWGEKDPPPTK